MQGAACLFKIAPLAQRVIDESGHRLRPATSREGGSARIRLFRLPLVHATNVGAKTGEPYELVGFEGTATSDVGGRPRIAADRPKAE
jgi:hypothetical protein